MLKKYGEGNERVLSDAHQKFSKSSERKTEEVAEPNPEQSKDRL